jgi:hypothetical protein
MKKNHKITNNTFYFNKNKYFEYNGKNVSFGEITVSYNI